MALEDTPQNRRTGEQLAELGGQIYMLADENGDIEGTEDFNRMMYHLNKLSYRLIHGHERDECNTTPARPTVVRSTAASTATKTVPVATGKHRGLTGSCEQCMDDVEQGFPPLRIVPGVANGLLRGLPVPGRPYVLGRGHRP